jgi:hypothetical protein
MGRCPELKHVPWLYVVEIQREKAHTQLYTTQQYHGRTDPNLLDALDNELHVARPPYGVFGFNPHYL